MEYNNKEKSKEQNGSRLRDTNKGLVITKGDGAWEDGSGGRGGFGDTIIHNHNVGWLRERQYSTEKTLMTLLAIFISHTRMQK